MPRPRNGFPQRWRKFISHYLKTLNATESAIKAGYSEKSAAEIGCRLLKRESIKSKITAELEATLGANRATLRKRIVNELEAEAFNQGSQRIKALELLAKYSKLLEDAPAVSNTFILQWPNDPNPTP